MTLYFLEPMVTYGDLGISEILGNLQIARWKEAVSVERIQQFPFRSPLLCHKLGIARWQTQLGMDQYLWKYHF